MQQLNEEDLAQKISYKLLQQPGEFPSFQEIANDIGKSKSVITRSLREVGTNFQALLDKNRKNLAIEHLQNAELTLEDIAYLVGFSNAGNFNRAFKKWTGKTPTSFRNN